MRRSQRQEHRLSVVEAVVFDMDGVLVDSEALWRQVREEFAAEIGQVWGAADQASTMGCNTADWSRIMVERLALRTRLGMDEAGVAREIIERMRSKYRAHLPEREGAIDAVHRAAARYRVALASGSPAELGEFVLGVTGLDKVFVATLYGDAVERGKPAPDIYLRVLREIGVRPENAVGVEDSGNGIRSLAAAGIAIIAAPGPLFPLPPEVLAMADVHIQEMTEFRVELVERAAAVRAGRPARSRGA
jgi:mannitol-1-/sugar-/sorbitol-6-/2-deoxyglucose-6-phosphatase